MIGTMTISTEQQRIDADCRAAQALTSLAVPYAEDVPRSWHLRRYRSCQPPFTRVAVAILQVITSRSRRHNFDRPYNNASVGLARKKAT